MPTFKEENGKLWELRWVEAPPDAHRCASRETPGASRELLRANGSGDLLGPPESLDFIEDGGVESQELLENSDEGASTGDWRERLGAILGEEFIHILEEVGVPYVRGHVHSLGIRVQTEAEDRVEKARRAREGRRAQRRSDTSSAKTAAADESRSIRSAIDLPLPHIVLNSEEWAGAVRQLVALEAYAALLRELIEHAEITDADLNSELLEEHRSVLASRSSVLDGKSRKLVADLLGRTFYFTSETGEEFSSSRGRGPEHDDDPLRLSSSFPISIAVVSSGSLSEPSARR